MASNLQDAAEHARIQNVLPRFPPRAHPTTRRSACTTQQDPQTSAALPGLYRERGIMRRRSTPQEHALQSLRAVSPKWATAAGRARCGNDASWWVVERGAWPFARPGPFGRRPDPPFFFTPCVRMPCLLPAPTRAQVASDGIVHVQPVSVRHPPKIGDAIATIQNLAVLSLTCLVAEFETPST